MNNLCSNVSYKVIATRGHIFEIKGLSAIHKKTFQPTYSILESQAQHARLLKGEVARAGGGIILAMDDDREGEAIAWHLCILCGLDPTCVPRIVFREITETAILSAISNPRRIDKNLVLAQQTRAVLDMLVGYKISPLLWKYVPHQQDATTPLSAGRCQTPALRLIHDAQEKRQQRLRALEDLDSGTGDPLVNLDVFVYRIGARFKLPSSVVSHTIQATCKTDATPFTSPESVREFIVSSSRFEHFLSPLSDMTTILRTVDAPSPFTTSSLIQTAARTLNMSAKEIMNICQSLYQNGLITYHRTDSTSLSCAFKAQAQSFLAASFGSASVYGRDNSHNSSSQPKAEKKAHEAIRPTSVSPPSLPTLTKAAHQLYDLIRTRTLQSCMQPAIYTGFKISVKSAMESVFFESTIEYIARIGWILMEKLSPQQKNDNKAMEAIVHYLESINIRQQSLHPSSDPVCIHLQMMSMDANATLSPQYAPAPLLSEHNLIGELERLSIGRPSTFASIVDTLYKRNYISKRESIPGIQIPCPTFSFVPGSGSEPIVTTAIRDFGQERNKLWVHPVGQKVLSFLQRNFDQLFEYSYTATMEAQLDDISLARQENSTTDYQEKSTELCKACSDFIKQHTSVVKHATAKPIPLLPDSPNFEVTFTEKSGPVIIEHVVDLDTQQRTGETRVLRIRQDIVLDVMRLKEGKYTLDDLIELPHGSLGEYQGFPLFLRHGKFGYYVEFGETRRNLKHFKLPPTKTSYDQLSFSDIVQFLEAPTAHDPNLLRYVSPVMSVYNGRWGPYLRYTKTDSGVPKTISLKKFKAPGGYLGCDPELLEQLV
jgi:DNA topoisomerase-1